MKQSKKRDHLNSRKRKHATVGSVSLETWDQTDLEDADEKVLEKRLHQLKMQLEMAQDEGTHKSRRSFSKYKKKHGSEDRISTDSDSSDSDSSLSSTSSISASKFKSKKSSSNSDDDRRKYRHGSRSKRKLEQFRSSRDVGRGDRETTMNSKSDKKFMYRKKASPISDKYSSRKKSPSLDKREVYSRGDTGRWHEKAKEFGKERNKREQEHERTRARSRADRNRSNSAVREPRPTVRDKEDRIPKKLVSRAPTMTVIRRKDSPESTQTRVPYDGVRRTTVLARKVSPRDERTPRHDERRLDLKVTRRNDLRSDLRDVNLRITRDVHERKDPLPKAAEKTRDREITSKIHRAGGDVVDHSNSDTRDRGRVNDDRFKDRDKRLHDRLESDRNSRSIRHDSRESLEDKFRRNDRPADTNRLGGVFDRMRNRYNDRRNAENNQRLGRDRTADVKKDRPLDKEPPKAKSNDMNGADKLIRDRRPVMTTSVVGRLPIQRDRKEPERNIIEKRSRSPVNFDRKFSSPLNVRKIRDTENRLTTVKRTSAENDDPLWNKKKPLNKARSRSRSSEKRRRRRSSQEEWRVIDMTSPVLDGEFSDENNSTFENSGQNKSKRPGSNKAIHSCRNDASNDSDVNKQNKSILTDELSDISDEDFNDVNANSHLSQKMKKDGLHINDRLSTCDQSIRKIDQKPVSDRVDLKDDKASPPEIKSAVNEVDDLITDQKLPADEAERVDLGKVTEDIDSEEDTVSRVSDALGVDWTDLVEESKKKTPSTVDASFSIRRRWSANSIFASIGISRKYAGEELFNQIQKDISSDMDSTQGDNASGPLSHEETDHKFWHHVASLHVSLKNKALKRRTLFEPYKTAISARKDIAIRRRLCGLPVKNLHTQQMIGICHWIV